MALLTMIARVVDGLPLVGTMQEDEQVGESIVTLIIFILSIIKIFWCYSPDEEFLNTKIRRKCCFENWDRNHRRDALLKLDHIFFSKF